MPRNFLLYVNDVKIGNFTCRDSAVYSMHTYYTKNNVGRDKFFTTPAKFTVMFYDSTPCDFSMLQDYLYNALPKDTVELLVREERDQIWKYRLSIDISGLTPHVFHAFWWVVLFTRLYIERKTPELPAPKALINCSSRTSWYSPSASYDRSEAAQAYEMIDQVDVEEMWLCNKGPVQILGL